MVPFSLVRDLPSHETHMETHSYTPGQCLHATPLRPGVLAYVLLCGWPPFFAETDAQLERVILKGEYQFHKDSVWDQVPAGLSLPCRALAAEPRLGPHRISWSIPQTIGTRKHLITVVMKQQTQCFAKNICFAYPPPPPAV